MKESTLNTVSLSSDSESELGRMIETVILVVAFVVHVRKRRHAFRAYSFMLSCTRFVEGASLEALAKSLAGSFSAILLLLVASMLHSQRAIAYEDSNSGDILILWCFIKTLKRGKKKGCNMSSFSPKTSTVGGSPRSFSVLLRFWGSEKTNRKLKINR